MKMSQNENTLKSLKPKIFIAENVPCLSTWICDVAEITAVEYLKFNGARVLELKTKQGAEFELTAGYFDLFPRGFRSFLEFRLTSDRKVWQWKDRPLKVDTIVSNQGVKRAHLLNLDVDGENCVAGLTFEFQNGEELQIYCAAYIVHLALFGDTKFTNDAAKEYDRADYTVYRSFET
jgi:hypothetical protein